MSVYEKDLKKEIEVENAKQEALKKELEAENAKQEALKKELEVAIAEQEAENAKLAKELEAENAKQEVMQKEKFSLKEPLIDSGIILRTSRGHEPREEMHKEEMHYAEFVEGLKPQEAVLVEPVEEEELDPEKEEMHYAEFVEGLKPQEAVLVEPVEEEEEETQAQKLDRLNKLSDHGKATFEGEKDGLAQKSYLKSYKKKGETTKKEKAKEKVAETAVCTEKHESHGKKAMTDKIWEEIKVKVIDGTECQTSLGDDKELLLVDFKIKLNRLENGFKVSSDEVPPDAETMAKSFKLAAQVTGAKTANIGSSSDPLTTAKLILELSKEPYPIKVVTNDNVIDGLRNDKRKECVDALKVYEEMNKDEKPKSKPKS